MTAKVRANLSDFAGCRRNAPEMLRSCRDAGGEEVERGKGGLGAQHAP